MNKKDKISIVGQVSLFYDLTASSLKGSSAVKYIYIYYIHEGNYEIFSIF